MQHPQGLSQIWHVVARVNSSDQVELFAISFTRRHTNVAVIKILINDLLLPFEGYSSEGLLLFLYQVLKQLDLVSWWLHNGVLDPREGGQETIKNHTVGNPCIGECPTFCSGDKIIALAVNPNVQRNANPNPIPITLTLPYIYPELKTQLSPSL